MTVKEFFIVAQLNGFENYQICVAEDVLSHFTLEKQDIIPDFEKQKIWIVKGK